MKAPFQNRRLYRGVIAAIVCWGFSAVTADAQVPRPVERAGRVFGFGWGDGYHTCATSKIRLGADLPPRSFTSGHLYRKLAARAAVGGTFYDRFDACNGNFCPCDGCCGGQGCDRCGYGWGGCGGCDRCCDDLGCDTAPVTVIRGSEVIQGHTVPVPEAMDALPETEPSPLPPPLVNPPRGDGASSKPSPIRPSAPKVAAAEASPTRRRPRKVVPLGQIALPDTSVAAADLVPAGIPDSILHEKLAQPASEGADPAPRASLAEDLLGDMVGESGLAQSNFRLPWRATRPVIASAPAKPSSKPRPTRLGQNTGGGPATQATSPTQLGGVDFTRPFGRPLVDIADRISESSDQVISQPSLRR